MNPSEEFSELLRTHGDMAYRMAFQLTGGREAEASDLVQEVFIKIWRQWDQQRPSSMKGWMYRVLRNLFLDAVRHRSRFPSVPLHNTESPELSLEERLPDGQPSTQKTLEQKELQRQVSDALAQMDEEFRTPVVLCDMEGLPYEDIARILACPIGTVRSRIHRGRLQLRHLLRTLKPVEVNYDLR